MPVMAFQNGYLGLKLDIRQAQEKAFGWVIGETFCILMDSYIFLSFNETWWPPTNYLSSKIASNSSSDALETGAEEIWTMLLVSAEAVAPRNNFSSAS